MSIELDEGGIHAAEALMNARYFMFMQVYYHKARVAYDEHLREFLRSWLSGGNFPIAPTGRQPLTDNEVTAGIARDGLDQVSDGFFHANATRSRRHFLQLLVAREYSTDAPTRTQAMDASESGERDRYGQDAFVVANTDYHFVLFMHSAFSFDAHEVLTWMKSRREFGIERYDLYGTTLRLTPYGQELAREHTELTDQMQWVISRIAPTNVLEVSTVCMLKLGAPDWTYDSVTQNLDCLKPRTSHRVALRGINEFETLRHEARAAGVILQRDECTHS